MVRKHYLGLSFYILRFLIQQIIAFIAGFRRSCRAVSIQKEFVSRARPVFGKNYPDGHSAKRRFCQNLSIFDDRSQPVHRNSEGLLQGNGCNTLF